MPHQQHGGGAQGQGQATGNAAGFFSGGGGFGLFGGLLGVGLGVVSGIQQERAIRRARRRQRKAIREAGEIAERRVSELTREGTLFSKARSFLEESFDNAGNTSFARQAAQGVQAAQASRGTFFGNQSALQEGLARGFAAEQLKLRLAPLAQQFAFAPEQLRQSIESQQAPLRVAAATGAGLAGVGPSPAVSPFNLVTQQAIQGAAGGFAAGQSFDQRQLTLNQIEELRRQRQAQGGGVGAQPIAGQGFDASRFQGLG